MKDSGVPEEQHLLVVRVTGRNGVDLHTPAALEEYLEGRHYEELFSWPEQGLVVYLVGSRCPGLRSQPQVAVQRHQDDDSELRIAMASMQ